MIPLFPKHDVQHFDIQHSAAAMNIEHISIVNWTFQFPEN